MSVATADLELLTPETVPLEEAEELVERRYTLDEFFELDLPPTDCDESEYFYELIKGKLMKRRKGSGNIHSAVLMKLSGYISNYVAEKKVGRGFCQGETTLGGTLETFVRPDLFYLVNDLPLEERIGTIDAVPELVVELNSSSDTLQGVHDKIEVYREAGVKLIWSVYLPDQFIIIHRADNPNVRLLNLADDLEGEDVLPGLKLTVQALFD